MRCLCSGQFLYCEHRMRIRKYTLLVPLNFNPRRITNNQIKPATLCKQVCKFKLPVHELVLFCDSCCQIQSRSFLTQSRNIYDGIRTVSVDNIHCHLFHFCREQRKLATLDRISNIHRCHGSFKNQGHIKQEFTSARKQIRLVNRPEPQRTPIVHRKLQSCIRTGIPHVFALIAFAEDLVLLANRRMRILCVIGIAKDREGVLCLYPHFFALLNLRFP